MYRFSVHMALVLYKEHVYKKNLMRKNFYSSVYLIGYKSKNCSGFSFYLTSNGMIDTSTDT